MGDEDDKDIEKQWKEMRKKSGADEGENRRRSSQFFTAVLKLSKQKDQDAILQLKNLKSTLRHSSLEQLTPTAIHLTDEEKRMEKQIENMMGLESVSLSDGAESVDDDKCDICGYRSTEALTDCCFRVGFVQLAIGVLSGCVHIFLSFAADEQFGIIEDTETKGFHPLAITGNVLEAVAYGLVSLAGLSIICAVCLVRLRKKWLAALHFGICLASPFIFLSVVTIVSQYGTTFEFSRSWLDPLWIAIHSVQVIIQFMFSSFSWRLLTSMDAIISDDMDEDKLIFDAIERGEDAFRKRMPKI